MAKNYWRATWWAILDIGGQTQEAFSNAALRLTNDLRPYFSDLEEGKTHLRLIDERLKWASELDDHCWRWAYTKWIKYHRRETKERLKKFEPKNASRVAKKNKKEQDNANKDSLRRDRGHMAKEAIRGIAPRFK